MNDTVNYTQVIEEYMMDILISLNQKFSSAYTNELSANQQLVLTLLDKNETLTIRKIAEKINVSTSAVSQMLSKMERMNFVKRVTSHHDRRLIHIHLTGKGKRVIHCMEKTRHEIITHYLFKMNLDDLRLLSEIIKNLRNLIWMEGEGRNDEIK
ncbi:MarR family winged helix-turn-helix transcriptional regulator [Pueribacillus sp. YX66]|uniref:MarR family winged helix-turn-helix transcriptional regulator n=1 Tax=Pueribacillus sp. YX66 TaxID=3229242 RepID=UPI00358D9608